MRTGDGVRVEAKVTSGVEAHLYLVWLTLEAGQRLHAPFHPWQGKWEQFDRGKDIRRSGSAALDLAYVAAGRYDGYFEIGLKPWDMAAGVLLVREAGGRYGDFAGLTEKLDYLERKTV